MKHDYRLAPFTDSAEVADALEQEEFRTQYSVKEAADHIRGLWEAAVALDRELLAAKQKVRSLKADIRTDRVASEVSALKDKVQYAEREASIARRQYANAMDVLFDVNQVLPIGRYAWPADFSLAYQRILKKVQDIVTDHQTRRGTK